MYVLRKVSLVKLAQVYNCMAILLIIYKVDGARYQDKPAAVYRGDEEGTEIEHLQTQKIY